MGIGDRAYMRHRRIPRFSLSATAWIVGILVGFFVLNLIQESAGANFLGWMPLDLAAPQPWQWLSYALYHTDFWHLLVNCLILGWTASTVEREHGSRIMLGVLACGSIMGAVFWALTGIGGVQAGSLIGVSAGAYALMLLALLGKLEQQITVLLFFFLPVTIKVRWVLFGTILFAVLGWGFSELPSRHEWQYWKASWKDDIGHSAHLGGLLLGWLAWIYTRRTNSASASALWQPHMDYSPPSLDLDTQSNSDTPERSITRSQARAEIDILLDKISAEGFGSLTAGEKRRLEELSAILR